MCLPGSMACGGVHLPGGNKLIVIKKYIYTSSLITFLSGLQEFLLVFWCSQAADWSNLGCRSPFDE